MATPARRPAHKIGPFLRAVEWWRNHLGLKHGDFAQRLTLSAPYWSQIRNGKRPLTLHVVELILADRPDLRHALSDELLARGRSSAPSRRRPSRLRARGPAS